MNIKSRHQLPVPLDKITGIGQNPLKEEWKHPASHMQYAWDFGVPRGTPIYATKDGKVIDVRADSDREATREELDIIDNDPDNPKSIQLAMELFKAANRVIIEHNDGTCSLYSHLQKDGSKVKVEDKVKAGQHIGYSGNTGISDRPHLHFEIYKPYPDIDPILAVNGEDGGGSDQRESIEPKFSQKELEYLIKLAEEKD